MTCVLQASAAAWSADDDAHEDKSEIDEQLTCVRAAAAAAAAATSTRRVFQHPHFFHPLYLNLNPKPFFHPLFTLPSSPVHPPLQICMLARCNVAAAASFIITRMSPLVASHVPAVISTLHPSQRSVLHEQLYWMIRCDTCHTCHILSLQLVTRHAGSSRR